MYLCLKKVDFQRLLRNFFSRNGGSWPKTLGDSASWLKNIMPVHLLLEPSVPVARTNKSMCLFETVNRQTQPGKSHLALPWALMLLFLGMCTSHLSPQILLSYHNKEGQLGVSDTNPATCHHLARTAEMGPVSTHCG